MAANAIGLSIAEKQAVAISLQRRRGWRIRSGSWDVCARCGASRSRIASGWNGFGNDASNSRFQNAKAAGLTAADVPKLT